MVKAVGLSFFFLSTFLVELSVFLTELINTTCCVNELRLTGVEWV